MQYNRTNKSNYRRYLINDHLIYETRSLEKAVRKGFREYNRMNLNNGFITITNLDENIDYRFDNSHQLNNQHVNQYGGKLLLPPISLIQSTPSIRQNQQNQQYARPINVQQTNQIQQNKPFGAQIKYTNLLNTSKLSNPSETIQTIGIDTTNNGANDVILNVKTQKSRIIPIVQQVPQNVPNVLDTLPKALPKKDKYGLEKLRRAIGIGNGRGLEEKIKSLTEKMNTQSGKIITMERQLELANQTKQIDIEVVARKRDLHDIIKQNDEKIDALNEVEKKYGNPYDAACIIL
jgi:hypothetical protein